jgi:hypothetical protein
LTKLNSSDFPTLKLPVKDYSDDLSQLNCNLLEDFDLHVNLDHFIPKTRFSKAEYRHDEGGWRKQEKWENLLRIVKEKGLLDRVNDVDMKIKFVAFNRTYVELMATLYPKRSGERDPPLWRVFAVKLNNFIYLRESLQHKWTKEGADDVKKVKFANKRFSYLLTEETSGHNLENINQWDKYLSVVSSQLGEHICVSMNEVEAVDGNEQVKIELLPKRNQIERLRLI